MHVSNINAINFNAGKVRLDKIDSKTNLSYINKDRKKHFIMLKWMIQQWNITSIIE